MTTTTVRTTADKIGAVQLQQSSLGPCVPAGWGRFRVPSNLLYYGDFKSVAVTTTTRSGGKGGSVKQKNTTYDYFTAFQAALTQGLVLCVPKVWVAKKAFTGGTTYSGTATATELFAIPSNGSVKVSAYSRIASVTSVHLCQGSGETADTALTAGTHYSLVGMIVQVDVTTFPQYKGRSVRVVYTYNQTGLVSALGAAGFPFFAQGSVGQAPYSYMTTNHPSEALGYSETALVGASAYQLGDGAELPNHNFEVISRMQFPGKDDAMPGDIVLDYLTNPSFGALFPSERIAGLDTYSNYCIASGLFLSPCYTDQSQARTTIAELMAMTNSDVVWSDGQLKIWPYGDATVTANGVTFTPNLVPLYDLTDDDFVVSGEEDPVLCERKTPADAFNNVQIEVLNRANDYNVEPIEAKDQANIEAYGLRTREPIALHAICDVTVGKQVAQLMLQRALYVRNVYTFKLDWRYSLLEPLIDTVTITDAYLGLNKWPVRIVSIDENDDASWTVKAEDFPAGIGSAAAYPNQTSSGYIPNYSISPGNVATPSFFEPPIELTDNGLEVWAAVTGVDVNWGGCTVWASYDGSTYKRLGTVRGGSRYGVTTASTTSSAGAVSSVQLAGLGGQILAAASGDCTNKATLCLIGDEFVGHTSANLTGANAYDLTLANRSFYSSPAASYASGTRFVRVDDRMIKSDPLDYSMIGQTLRFKFTSFNIYGSGEQSLADVPEYTYIVRGNMLALPPTTVSSVTYALEGFGIRLNWATVPDQDVSEYEIRTGGTAWSDATFLASVKGSSYLWAVQTLGSRVVRIRAKDVFGNYSLADATVTTVVAAPGTLSPAAVFSADEVVMSWAAVTGSFNIDRYEIRTGASWAAGTLVAISYTTTFKEKAVWLGSKTYWIAAIDVAGNVGTAVSVTPTVLAPADVAATIEVIDNNVLQRWSDSTTTLPIVSYAIRRGSSWAAGTVVGTGGSGRFATFFEQVGGTYTYWTQATDSAGNVSTPTSTTALVNQPPDYVLRSDIYSTFSGTLSSAVLQGGKLYAPLNATETYAQHFTNNSWTSPQDQVTAGKTYYFQPSTTSGYYEETIDYGVTIPSSGIAITITSSVLNGAVTVTPKISVKLNIGDSWTDYAGQSQVVASNFRYIKVRYDFAASGGDDLIEVTAINIKLSTKIRTDTGTGSAVSTDSGGTTVTFNIAFLDVTSLEVTPLATTAVIATYDFTDAPNPTSFKVLLFNTSGTRVSGPFSWSAKGI